jgi:hypothetical protein
LIRRETVGISFFNNILPLLLKKTKSSLIKSFLVMTSLLVASLLPVMTSKPVMTP